MKPALRNKRIKDKRKIVKLLNFKLLSILFIFLIFFLLITSIKKSNSLFKDKVSLAVRNEDGGVNVLIFDYRSEEIVNIYIPGSTQVEVARDLGIWRLKNVWKLGQQEKVKGELLAKTVTKQFMFPVFFWSDSKALGFLSSNLFNVISSVFSNYETNLNFFQKLNLALFSLKVENSKHIDINLAKTHFLKEDILLDGEEGYRVYGSPPDKILAFFTDPSFLENGLRIMLVDLSGRVGVSENVGKILEVLGGKITSLVKEDSQNLNCSVSGKDKIVLEKVKLLFSCSEEKDNLPENFDLKIIIGSKFIEKN